jgi:hypothetical protein
MQMLSGFILRYCKKKPPYENTQGILLNEYNLIKLHFAALQMLQKKGRTKTCKFLIFNFYDSK